MVVATDLGLVIIGEGQLRSTAAEKANHSRSVRQAGAEQPIGCLRNGRRLSWGSSELRSN